MDVVDDVSIATFDPVDTEGGDGQIEFQIIVNNENAFEWTTKAARDEWVEQIAAVQSLQPRILITLTY